LTQENLLGTGQRLSVNVNTDSANTVYNISFTNPYHTIDGVSRTISLSFAKRDAAEEEINDFQTDSYSANINYGIPLTEFTTLRLGYGWSHVELMLSSVNPSLEATDFVAEYGESYDNILLNASYTYDTRNRTVFATRGSSQTVALNLSAPGSDLEFYKLSYLTKFYFGLTDDLTLLLRSNLAYGSGYGDLDGLPFYERYFAGGLRTVRGFDSNSLGPRDDYGDPTGGNMRITAGADLIFPIPFVDKPPSSVRFSAFYDIGNVFLDGAPTYNSTEDGFAVEELRASTGLSFVWLAPIGPLRFSWSKALNDVEGDNLRMKKIIIVALSVMAICSNAIAADNLKVGFVSVEKLLTQAPQVEAVNADMLKRFGGKKDELVAMEAEIKTMQENYKRNELVMTEDKLTELKTKLYNKVQIFKQKEQVLGQEVNTVRSQELAVLQKSVREIIQNVAKKDGYDLILSDGVVFAADKLDITNVILEQMKKDFKK